LSRWQDAPWPGNIRELRNAVARRHAMGQSSLAAAPPDEESLSLDEVLTRDLPLAEVRRIVNERLERAYVERMLDKNGGVVTRAAEASGIARPHFRRIRARTRKDGVRAFASFYVAGRGAVVRTRVSSSFCFLGLQHLQHPHDFRGE
jgi:DNA-binding NtrC family response regulator